MNAFAQRSEEWFRARCGSLGASQIADALARTKTGWAYHRARTSWRNSPLERLTGVPTEGFTHGGHAMGNRYRAGQARTAYSFMTNAGCSRSGTYHPPEN